MSGGITATTVLAAAAVAGTAYSVYSSERAASAQAKAQNAAQQQAKDAALKQEKVADEANNRVNQKRPDTSAILDAASQAGRGGASGTMLTGTLGVDPSALSLGKNTLLG